MQPMTIAVVLIAVAMRSAAGDELLPQCGRVTGTTVRSGDTKTFQFARDNYGYLGIECFNYDAHYTASASRDDGHEDPICATRAKSPHEFFDIFFVNGQNRWNISGVFRKSIVGASFTVPESAAGIFKLEFVNKHPSCGLLFRYTAQGYLLSANQFYPSLADPLPAITTFSPHVFFKGSVVNFVMNVPGGVDPSRADWAADGMPQMFLLQDHKTCHKTLAPSNAPRLQVVPGNAVQWSTVFPHTGTFLVCMKAERALHAIPIGAANVHGGNPAYYKIVSGVDASQHVSLGARVELKFTGLALDATGDHAKLVTYSSSCAEGRASIAIHAESLLPSATPGDFGHTLWTFRVLGPGMWRVCYRRQRGDWIDVLSFQEMSLAAKESIGQNLSYLVDPQYTAPPASRPTYNGHVCDLAPERDQPPAGPTLIQLVMDAPALPGNFAVFLSTLLCVPPNVIFVHSMKRLGESEIQITMGIGEDGSGNYTARERMDYLVFVGASDMEKLKPIDVTKLTEVLDVGFVTVDESDPLAGAREDNHRTALISGLVVGLVGIVCLVLAVVVFIYKKRQFPVPVVATVFSGTGPNGGVYEGEVVDAVAAKEVEMA